MRRRRPSRVASVSGAAAREETGSVAPEGRSREQPKEPSRGEVASRARRAQSAGRGKRPPANQSDSEKQKRDAAAGLEEGGWRAFCARAGSECAPGGGIEGKKGWVGKACERLREK